MAKVGSLFLVASLAAVAPSACLADLIHDDNMVVTGNLTANSHVDGKTVVGGTLGGSGGVFAQAMSTTTVDTLVVGGSITATSDSLQAGTLRYAVGPVTGFNVNGGSTSVHDASVANIGSTDAAILTSLSQSYAALAATGTVTAIGSQPTAVKFTAGPVANNTSVFVVDGSIFSNPNAQSFDLDLSKVATNATVVINVTDASDAAIKFSQGNFLSGFQNNDSRIIWNFLSPTDSHGNPLSESIGVNVALYGTMLAPTGQLSNASNIYGGVFVQDFTMGAEVHYPLFTGSRRSPNRPRSPYWARGCPT